MNQPRLIHHLFIRILKEFKGPARRFHTLPDVADSNILRANASSGLRWRTHTTNIRSTAGIVMIQHHDPNINSSFPVQCRMCSEARDVDLSRTQFYFDTHALVKKFEAAGFSVEQSQAVTEALVQVLNSQIEHQNRMLVTKSQQEITVQQLLANISSVKKDMLILEKSEFSALRNETEKQTMEIDTMKKTVQDEIAKLKGQISLDINLEKSRAKEAHAEGEKDRSMLNNRIDMEVANLRTTYEQYRNDVLKYAGGTVLSCLTITLGFYRLWS